MTTQTMTPERTAARSVTQQTNGQYILPRVNIYETNEDVSIEAELPGVPKSGVDIEVKDRELIVTGKRAQNGETGSLRFRERPVANYRRTFTLGRAVDTDKIDATMENGLLKIRLHKADEAKTRKIAIN